MVDRSSGAGGGPSARFLTRESDIARARGGTKCKTADAGKLVEGWLERERE